MNLKEKEIMNYENEKNRSNGIKRRYGSIYDSSITSNG